MISKKPTVKFAEGRTEKDMVDAGRASHTDDTRKERDDEQNDPNDINTTQSPVEPEPMKPRTDKDDGGQNVLATDEVVSEKPSIDLTCEPLAWSGTCPESELKKGLRERAAQHAEQRRGDTFAGRASLTSFMRY